MEPTVSKNISRTLYLKHHYLEIYWITYFQGQHRFHWKMICPHKSCTSTVANTDAFISFRYSRHSCSVFSALPEYKFPWKLFTIFRMSSAFEISSLSFISFLIWVLPLFLFSRFKRYLLDFSPSHTMPPWTVKLFPG